MNHTVANWYKSKIQNIDWIDAIAGLVRTISVQRPTGDKGAITTLRFPVSVEVEGDQCTNATNLKALAPDSSKRTVVYFEDGGVSMQTINNRRVFVSTLRLVCWVNARKLTFTGDDPTPIMIAQVLNAIGSGFENYGNLSAMKNINVAIAPVNNGLFAEYTFDSGKQLLMKPYHAFALDLETQFNIPLDCEGLIENNDDACA